MKLRLGVTTALIAAAALSVTGCVATARESSTPSSPPNGAQSFSAPGDQKLRHADPNTGPLLPWKTVSDDRQSEKIELTIIQHGCVVPVGVDVRESDRDVVIAAIGKRLQQPCTTSKSSITGFVRLETPLGTRNLVDARNR
jgi:hypothetical protein